MQHPYAFNKNKKAKGTDDDIYTKEFGYKLVKENLKDYIQEYLNLDLKKIKIILIF